MAACGITKEPWPEFEGRQYSARDAGARSSAPQVARPDAGPAAPAEANRDNSAGHALPTLDAAAPLLPALVDAMANPVGDAVAQEALPVGAEIVSGSATVQCEEWASVSYTVSGQERATSYHIARVAVDGLTTDSVVSAFFLKHSDENAEPCNIVGIDDGSCSSSGARFDIPPGTAAVPGSLFLGEQRQTNVSIWDETLFTACGSLESEITFYWKFVRR